MIAETTLMMERHKIMTFPKKIIDALVKKGWRDGPVFVYYDEKVDVLRVIRREKMAKILEKGNADGEICTFPHNAPCVS